VCLCTGPQTRTKPLPKTEQRILTNGSAIDSAVIILAILTQSGGSRAHPEVHPDDARELLEAIWEYLKFSTIRQAEDLQIFKLCDTLR